MKTKKPNREKPILGVTIPAVVRAMVVDEAARRKQTLSDFVEQALRFYAEKKGIPLKEH